MTDVRPRSALALLVVLSLLLVAGARPDRVLAQLTATRSVGGNTFMTAADWGACAAKNAFYVAGLERGPAVTNTWGSFDGGVTTGGTPTVTTAAARSGAYGLSIPKANTGATYGFKTIPAASGTFVARFAINLPSLPSADVAQLTEVNPTAGSPLNLRYRAATTRLELGFGTTAGSVSTVGVVPGTWYVIDLRVTVSTNPRTAAWRINGTDQTAVSATEATSTHSTWRLGSATTTDAFTAYWDDIIMSTAAADYPFGDGRVKLLLPNGVGSHSSAANFQNDDNTAINATTHLRLDDIPMNTSTDYVKQIANSATSYVELTLSDVTDTCFNAILGFVTYHSGAKSGADSTNNGKTSVFSGSTETIIHSGNMFASAATLGTNVLTPPATPWSQAAVNALVVRVGYSTDVVPTPYWDAVAIEYDSPV